MGWHSCGGRDVKTLMPYIASRREEHYFQQLNKKCASPTKTSPRRATRSRQSGGVNKLVGSVTVPDCEGRMKDCIQMLGGCYPSLVWDST